MILSLNIRSLQKHYKDFQRDYLAGPQVIALQETWCDPAKANQPYSLPGYDMYFESRGKGKGVAMYFKEGFRVSNSVNTESYQMIQVTSCDFNVINVYCSKGANKQQLYKDICAMRGDRFCLVVGDFNDNYLNEPKSPFVKHMLQQNFSQLVRKVGFLIMCMLIMLAGTLRLM